MIVMAKKKVIKKNNEVALFQMNKTYIKLGYEAFVEMMKARKHWADLNPDIYWKQIGGEIPKPS